MIASKNILKLFVFLLFIILGLFSMNSNEITVNSKLKDTIFTTKNDTILVERDIKIKSYFKYMDSIVNVYDSLKDYKLTEHLLVRANPWILDSLKNTDYYKMMKKDSFVYDQKELIVLHKGSRLIIPNEKFADSMLNSFSKTFIEINIPEFKLRIYEDSIQRFEFPVRVGRNERKYLKMGDRITNLKTKTGIGSIVDHVKNPDFYNPVNGKKYFYTIRDDNKTTKMPQIPWLVTEVNNVRNGQLIHPTTNPVTLSKAYSNGCIGTKEADAWVIYYYAPIGTKLIIKYNLNVTNEKGKNVVLKNIYGVK